MVLMVGEWAMPRVGAYKPCAHVEGFRVAGYVKSKAVYLFL